MNQSLLTTLLKDRKNQKEKRELYYNYSNKNDIVARSFESGNPRGTIDRIIGNCISPFANEGFGSWQQYKSVLLSCFHGVISDTNAKVSQD